MNNLKILASSVFVTLTFGIFQDSWSMQSIFFDSDPSVVKHKSSVQVDQLEQSFKQSSFYHSFMIEHYRMSVQTLRQDIFKMQDQLSSSGMSSKIDVIQKEIKEIEEKIYLQREVLLKYGQDREVTKQKIITIIGDLKKLKETIQQNIIKKPTLKEMYEDQIKEVNDNLESHQKYLPVLDESESALQITLEMTEKYVKKFGQQANSSTYIQESMIQKIKTLQVLYEEYVKGLCSVDIFPPLLPIIVLESLGIPSVQFSNMDTEGLFQLFARTMELPYVVLQTGEDKDNAYTQQLKVIVQNLTNRLYEDVFTIQLISSIVQNGKMTLDFGRQDKLLDRLVTNPKGLEILSEETKIRDLKIFKSILSTYGYQEQKPSPLLEAVIHQSSYGLLGLCVAALESYPITSWNEVGKIGLQTRIKGIKTSEELSAGIIESVYSILGRHINKKVLQKIEEILQESSGKSLVPSAFISVYI